MIIGTVDWMQLTSRRRIFEKREVWLVCKGTFEILNSGAKDVLPFYGDEIIPDQEVGDTIEFYYRKKTVVCKVLHTSPIFYKIGGKTFQVQKI